MSNAQGDREGAWLEDSFTALLASALIDQLTRKVTWRIDASCTFVTIDS